MSLALAKPLESNRLRSAIPVSSSSVSARRVSSAIQSLLAPSLTTTRQNWLGAVARLTSESRPDLRGQLVEFLDAGPLDLGNPLGGMSIGEIGVVYEALVALSNHRDRRQKGQYFTPDDVASFMARQVQAFGDGHWLDPCCGVGNLAWHLADAMSDPAEFVSAQLTLIDMDPVALRTAIALLVASFAADGDDECLPRLAARSRARDFLDSAALPRHDFVIVNPPYAATAPNARFRTAAARELYAYFLERISLESKGFIAVTPASHLSAAKYDSLRVILEERSGGEVFVFDNVPDTCFRGFKYGSTNTSKTNFVRAAITVSSPSHTSWRLTPILRWAARSRLRMWSSAHRFLVDLRNGPNGEWAKVMPGTEAVWDALRSNGQTLSDLVHRERTQFALHVASTPRYYISASKRDLNRGSKHVLYFRTREEMNRAYVLLNSSLPYWWWRCVDGGITLPIRTLLSLPLPAVLSATPSLVTALEESEGRDLVKKLNAGRQNENIRRPRELVESIDDELLRGVRFDFSEVFAADMFEEVSR
ncbi:N-6 DNA methylase [Microbacterium deminutum]|uniref:site-specific DNA-methyltransferase (adenine-specific) n=1 Tax=Microbacterium deminutum TaxID=344164 RepID=A0ABN2RLB3_9MICO